MDTIRHDPAAAITKAASRQTYYTIRLLADRERVEDAYRAYGYFRWVDDILDGEACSGRERRDFLERQKSLLERCYLGQGPGNRSAEENMLVQLVRQDQERNSGLQAYLRNMMKVMEFDALRRGRWITQLELDEYTRHLARAVTEAIHYFIGHDDFAPQDGTRYLAVSAAHITHMLRDTFEDARLGYYNVPREVLQAGRIGPQDVQSAPYRAWVRERVRLARRYFKDGKAYFARVRNLRCRVASCAYIARFEWLLDTLEREGCCLRPAYPERKSPLTGLRMIELTVASLAWGGGSALPEGLSPARPEKL
jgi:phytoene/squalene synthetase